MKTKSKNKRLVIKKSRRFYLSAYFQISKNSLSIYCEFRNYPQ
ncbi:hypothetical protein HMPREF3203_03131 [Proteus mirabilis]|nr:hypothetical protein HMPREF3203_03131 [Proteus mirabilis]